MHKTQDIVEVDLKLITKGGNAKVVGENKKKSVPWFFIQQHLKTGGGYFAIDNMQYFTFCNSQAHTYAGINPAVEVALEFQLNLHVRIEDIYREILISETFWNFWNVLTSYRLTNLFSLLYSKCML